VIVAHVGAVGGGAGTAALKIHDGIRRAGVESAYFTVDARATDASRGIRLLPRRDVAAWNSPRSLLFRAAIKAYHTRRPRGAGLFSYTSLPARTPFPFDLVRPDVVHLNWIAQGIDYRSFFRSIPAAQPVVWSLLDMEPFTGGCHYAAGCERYERGCGRCPQLNALRNPFDLSSITFARKRRLYAHLNLTVVAVSRAHCDEARRSPLFARVTDIRIIPVGIDTTMFAPAARAEARARFGLGEHELAVSFAAVDLMNVAKGFPTLLAALELMRGRASVRLLLAGGALPDDVRVAVPVVHAGFETDPRKLAAFYSAADVHVVPSMSEALGQVGLEAMACGTPVIGSRVGGIPDYVRDNGTGLLFTAGDAGALASSLDTLATMPDVRRRMAAAARALVASEFSVDSVTRAYLELYEQILRI
jgi:glycosyltransferase involved in cell wall biosynthesis